jgi:hypothetical protein
MTHPREDPHNVDPATKEGAPPAAESSPTVPARETTHVVTPSVEAYTAEKIHPAIVAQQRVEAANESILAQSRGQTRRSFLVAAASASAGYSFYRYLGRAPSDEMQPQPIRDAFLLNSLISRGVFRDHAMSPIYSLSRAGEIRVNGIYGLKMALKPETWRLQVVGALGTVHHPRFSKDVTAWQYGYVAEARSQEDEGHDTKVDPKILSSIKMAPVGMLGKAAGDENRTVRMTRGVEEAGESNSTLPAGTPGLLLTWKMSCSFLVMNSSRNSSALRAGVRSSTGLVYVWQTF